MRSQRTKMLAGIAALALLAGTSLVSAQEKSDQNATPQAQQPQAAQQMDKTAPAEKMGQELKAHGGFGDSEVGADERQKRAADERQKKSRQREQSDHNTIERHNPKSISPAPRNMQ